MSETTNIEWATSTGNPWIGCTKVSPGCKNCYAAELDANRFSKTMGGGTKENPVSHWGKGSPRVRTKAFWTDAVKWNAAAGVFHYGGERPAREMDAFGWRPHNPRIFPSLCDWLDDEVPIEWLADFLKLIHDTPNLDWLLLTKRPENFQSRMQGAYEEWNTDDEQSMEALEIWLDGEPWSNVWLGVSVEDQKRADERIPLLLQIPAKVRFLSVEPLLERVAIKEQLLPRVEDVQAIYAVRDHDHPRIKWVIVGGESGKDRRDCGVDAISDAAQQCVAAGIPVFVKQDCAFKPGQQGRIPNEIWALKQFPQ